MNGVKFDDKVRKRKIAILGTFLQDNDGSKFRDEVAKQKVPEKKLPCQFSSNPAKRNMKLVNAYLRWEKAKEVPQPKEAEKENNIAFEDKKIEGENDVL